MKVHFCPAELVMTTSSYDNRLQIFEKLEDVLSYESVAFGQTAIVLSHGTNSKGRLRYHLLFTSGETRQRWVDAVYVVPISYKTE